MSTWPTMLVECRGVAWGPERWPVTPGLDLTIEPGEVCTIVGPTGSGKTRLCRIACGAEPPVRGAIIVDGRDLTGKPREIRHRVTAVVPEAPLWPNRSPYSNLLFALRLYGVPKPADDRAVEALRLSEVPDRLFRAPSRTLSRFHRYGVWLAIHRLRGVRVLVMDEPFLRLGGLETDNLSRLIQEVVEEGGCALLTSNSADVPTAAARRRYRLTHGRLMPIETPTSWIEADPATLSHSSFAPSP